MSRLSSIAIAVATAFILSSATVPAGAATYGFSLIPGLESAETIFIANKGSSGGRRLGYTCSGLQCTCTGDVDCNDMFESGKCGDIASCDADTDTCKCLILLKSPQRPKVPSANTGTELKAN